MDDYKAWRQRFGHSTTLTRVQEHAEVSLLAALSVLGVKTGCRGNSEQILPLTQVYVGRFSLIDVKTKYNIGAFSVYLSV